VMAAVQTKINMETVAVMTNLMRSMRIHSVRF
jgi:hypothetical protein